VIGTLTAGCLVCGCNDLIPVLDLGVQSLTGLFPASLDEAVPEGPLRLVRCVGDCGLVQLRHVYPAHLLYGDGYGYRSGLNKAMIEHLRHVCSFAMSHVDTLQEPDIVLDIGSNDGTLLSFFAPGVTLVGVDPTIRKFGHYYPDHIEKIPDFFTEALWQRCFGSKKAKLVTSIAMFYDLVDPVGFARDVADVLADDGIWVSEQSYMPAMMYQNSYDTVCHEHVEYYGLRQIAYIARCVGLRVIDVTRTNANGGSFAVVMAHAASNYRTEPAVYELLREEESITASTYSRFASSVASHRDSLCSALSRSSARGTRTFGYGASTKGNVILQYCGLTSRELPYFAEVNEEKFGCFTPGSMIPIISEREAHAMRPDQFLVMPWHFRDSIIAREREFLRAGGNLLFPLPGVVQIGEKEVAA